MVTYHCFALTDHIGGNLSLFSPDWPHRWWITTVMPWLITSVVNYHCYALTDHIDGNLSLFCPDWPHRWWITTVFPDWWPWYGFSLTELISDDLSSFPWLTTLVMTYSYFFPNWLLFFKYWSAYLTPDRWEVHFCFSQCVHINATWLTMMPTMSQALPFCLIFPGHMTLISHSVPTLLTIHWSIGSRIWRHRNWTIHSDVSF